MNYKAAPKETKDKIRAWIKANEPGMYIVASYCKQLFDGELIEIVKPTEEFTCLQKKC